MMLKGRNEVAMAELDKAFTPDIVQIMDFMLDQNGSGVLCRLAIHKKQECYEVRSYKIVTSDCNRQVMSEVIGRKNTEWDAKDIFNQEAVCLEQDNWVYLNDESFELEEIMGCVENKLMAVKHISGITHIEAPRVLNGRFVKATPIHTGVRVFVVIDNNLKCWIAPSASIKGFKWEQGGEMLQELIGKLAMGRGMKGVAVECFIDNQKVWITRPIFYAGRWIEPEDDVQHEIALKDISSRKIEGINALTPMKVGVNALSALIHGERVAVMVKQGAACYIIGDEINDVSFSAGYEKRYHISCDKSGQRKSGIEMKYVPDMSYYSMQCAAYKENAAYF